jgi:integrase
MSARRLEPLVDKDGKRIHPGIYRRHSAACKAKSRCKCSYVVVWEHRGSQHKESFRTLAEAREAKGRRDSGDSRPTERITLGSYFAAWIENYAGRTARGFSETTRIEYRRPVKAHALPVWQSMQLGEVEPTDVRDLFGKMRREGATTSEIKKLRAPLSAMFATAVEDGKVRSNPVLGVRIPAAPTSAEPVEEKEKALTRAELSLLLAAVDDDWRLFFDFLWQTGLRIGEAIGLRWEHVDLGKRPMIRIREQVYEGERKKLKSTNGLRDLPLSPTMATRLLAHRRDALNADGKAPVFASARGTELSPGNVYGRVLAPAAISVGLYVEYEAVVKGKDGEPEKVMRKRSTVSFHTFRHTCASFLFADGKNIKQVQKWLGHADPGFTMRTYVHLVDEGVGDADFFDTVLDEDVDDLAQVEGEESVVA